MPVVSAPDALHSTSVPHHHEVTAASRDPEPAEVHATRPAAMVNRSSPTDRRKSTLSFFCDITTWRGHRSNVAASFCTYAVSNPFCQEALASKCTPSYPFAVPQTCKCPRISPDACFKSPQVQVLSLCPTQSRAFKSYSKEKPNLLVPEILGDEASHITICT